MVIIGGNRKKWRKSKEMMGNERNRRKWKKWKKWWKLIINLFLLHFLSLPLTSSLFPLYFFSISSLFSLTSSHFLSLLLYFFSTSSLLLLFFFSSSSPLLLYKFKDDNLVSCSQTLHYKILEWLLILCFICCSCLLT